MGERVDIFGYGKGWCKSTRRRFTDNSTIVYHVCTHVWAYCSLKTIVYNYTTPLIITISIILYEFKTTTLTGE